MSAFKYHEDVIKSLDELLCDYMVYYQKLRKYHWYVDGPGFYRLHERFEKLYDNAASYVDSIAERIVTIGGKPTATLQEFINKSRLNEDDGRPDPNTMVRNIREDIRQLDAFLHETCDIAERHDDRPTVNMLEDVMLAQEKEAWMLDAYLSG